MLAWFRVLWVCFPTYWPFLAAGVVLRLLLRNTSKAWGLPVGLLIVGGLGWLCAVGGNWMALAVGMAAISGAVGAAVCGVVLRILARKKS